MELAGHVDPQKKTVHNERPPRETNHTEKQETLAQHVKTPPPKHEENQKDSTYNISLAIAKRLQPPRNVRRE